MKSHQYGLDFKARYIITHTNKKSLFELNCPVFLIHNRYFCEKKRIIVSSIKKKT
jgi:hypothetical protein